MWVDALADTGIYDQHPCNYPAGPDGLSTPPHRIDVQLQRRSLLDRLTSTEPLTAGMPRGVIVRGSSHSRRALSAPSDKWFTLGSSTMMAAVWGRRSVVPGYGRNDLRCPSCWPGSCCRRFCRRSPLFLRRPWKGIELKTVVRSRTTRVPQTVVALLQGPEAGWPGTTNSAEFLPESEKGVRFGLDGTRHPVKAAQATSRVAGDPVCVVSWRTATRR